MSHACNFFFYVLLNKPFRTLLWKKIRNMQSTTYSATMTTQHRDSVRLRQVHDASSVALLADQKRGAARVNSSGAVLDSNGNKKTVKVNEEAM